MKVFQISCDAKPPDSRAEHYTPVVASERDRHWLGLDEFSGQPFSRKWRPIQLHISMPALPTPDFYDFGIGVFVCHQRAARLCGEPLEMCGELLPVTLEREKGRFFLYNVTNCINAVDYKRSKWKTHF